MAEHPRDSAGRYLYRTISKNDPHYSQFSKLGDTGYIKPRGGHNDLTRHVQLGETDSIFTSWSKSKNANWQQWGGKDYIQLRVNSWKMKNDALDVSEWSNFPWEQEVSIIDIVNNVERIR